MKLIGRNTTKMTRQRLGITGIIIDEQSYRLDVELIDKYQAFSAELLRLALLGITGVGLLLVTILTKRIEELNPVLLAPLTKIFLSISVLFFSFSSLFALAHRYYSTNGLFHHIRALKIKKKLDLKDKDKELQENEITYLENRLGQEESSKNRRYQFAGYCVYTSAFFLGIGAFALAFGLAQALFQGGTR